MGIYLGFIKDAFVVVVAQRAGQLVVVHVRFAFAIAPQSSYFVGIFDDELAGFSLKTILENLNFCGSSIKSARFEGDFPSENGRMWARLSHEV